MRESGGERKKKPVRGKREREKRTHRIARDGAAEAKNALARAKIFMSTVVRIECPCWKEGGG
jgi:hypothetical protein